MSRLTLFSKVTVILFATAGVQAAVLVHHRAARPVAVKVGDRFPRVTLQQDGVPLSVDLAKLPDCMHVVFVMPTCKMCQRLAPRWSQEFRDPQRPRTIAVSLSDYGPARAYLDGHGLNALPLYATGQKRAVRTGWKMGILTIPTIAVVRGGRVAALGVGPDYTLAGLSRRAGCPLPSSRR